MTEQLSPISLAYSDKNTWIKYFTQQRPELNTRTTKISAANNSQSLPKSYTLSNADSTTASPTHPFSSNAAPSPPQRPSLAKLNRTSAPELGARPGHEQVVAPGGKKTHSSPTKDARASTPEPVESIPQRLNRLKKRPSKSKGLAVSGPVDVRIEPDNVAEHMSKLSLGDEVPVPASTSPGIEQELQAQSLYKTELCRSFEETGTCRYGLKCQFAHGKAELRPVIRHPKYKTEVCKTWQSLGTCPYGTRCRFIHAKDEDFGSAFVVVKEVVEPTDKKPLAVSRLSVFADLAQESPKPPRPEA